MPSLNKALILALVLSTPSFSAQATEWTRHVISDSLSPTSDGNSSPCAGASGVVWVSDQRNAVAFWDRRKARYIPPLTEPRPSCVIRHPSLWGGEVAYARSPSYPCQTEILYWDGQDSHRVSYYTCPNDHPSLFGGSIAWDDYPRACWPLPCEPEDSEIWFWNGYGAWPVTENDVNDRYPSLYELTIAWESDGKVVYATMPDPELGMPLTPTTVAEGERPSLFGHKIAYSASDGSDYEIFLYDIESHETLQVTDDDIFDRYPRLYDGTLVWGAYDLNDWEIFYWDGTTTQKLTDDDIWQTEPTLWGTGLNTTIAYVEWWPETGLDSRIICLRPAVTLSTGPGNGEITLTWPSLEGRTYRVEYTDDLITWHVAADDVPSAGYGETSWTDNAGAGTIPPLSSVPQRFYRVCENE